MRRIPAITCAVSALALAGSVAASGNYVLIRSDRPARSVEVAEITPRRVVYREDGSGWVSVSRGDCVALLNPNTIVVSAREGWLRLADGQAFPGQALSGARPADDVFVWSQSSWLGRLEVPLGIIESVTFTPSAVAPPPGERDVLWLANGDHQEGYVVALGDPITIEPFEGADALEPIDLPLGRVASVRMVTPPREPRGRRLWLIDGTVFDVGEVTLGDDGFYRLEGVRFSEEDSKRIEVEGVAAVLFDQQGLVPFARLEPRRVEGPPTRYVVPAPRALDERASLDLARVEFRGPVVAHYLLPPGAAWLAAEAQMPLLARTWGDCDLVIRVDDQVVFSERLNGDHSSAAIGVPVDGSLLSIEVTEGSAGPIQDRVVLLRAMILVH